MATIQNNARLFGLDLSGLGIELQIAWRRMALWPVLSWLRPEPTVRWRRTDGREMLYRGPRRALIDNSKTERPARFEAVEIPESLLLLERVSLPKLPPDAMQGALNLAVQGFSPFPAADLLWVRLDTPSRGPMKTGGGQANSIPVAITSKPLVQAYLDEISSAALTPAAVEAWIDVPGGLPTVLPGFGEAARQRDQRVKQRVNVFLAAIVLVLLAAILVTPTLQLRLRALDALAQYARLQSQVASIVQQRESFVRAETLLQGLVEVAGPSVSALQIMDLITKALPDDTSLQSLQINSVDGPGKTPKVLLVGQTGNAAALMQHLGGQPGFRDVRAPSAAVKPLGSVKESFNIELIVDTSAVTAVAGGKP